MRSLPLSALLLVAAVATASPARADAPTLADFPYVHVSGFIQPQFEFVKGDPLTQRDVLGFVLSRARALVLGELHVGRFTFDYRLEVEGTPQFALFDAYVAARTELPGDGMFRLVLGQQKAPFSRQILVWDPDLQMIGKAQITQLAPSHQLGLSALLRIPHAQFIELTAGVYNGKGKNLVENPDTNFMYVGRLAFRPIGPRARLVESAFGENQLSIAADVSYNVQNLGDSSQAQLLVGADAFVSFRGFSAYAELVYGQTSFTANKPGGIVDPTYNSLGYNVQAGYLLPIPGYLYRRIEVAGRFESLLRNNTVALQAPGDTNQTIDTITAGLGYFQLAHTLKLQLNYVHNIWPADPNRNIKTEIADNAFYAQITYKLE